VLDLLLGNDLDEAGGDEVAVMDFREQAGRHEFGNALGLDVVGGNVGGDVAVREVVLGPPGKAYESTESGIAGFQRRSVVAHLIAH
jgi:hypothetical protein